MARRFEVKGAAALLDAGFIAKWQERRALDPLARAVLRSVVERFIAQGGPVSIEAVPALLPGHASAEVSAAVARLDEKNLIFVEGGQVLVAYPFAAAPTAFTVVLPEGRERYAVCAIDALGVPAMLGAPVVIRSHCHHCREPLEIHSQPDGPAGAREIMVWVGQRGELRQKACTSR